MKRGFSLLLALMLLFSIITPAAAEEREAQHVVVPLVVVYMDNHDQLSQLIQDGLDVVEFDEVNNEARVVMHSYEREYLDRNQWKYEILVEDLNSIKVEESKYKTFTAPDTPMGREDYRMWEDFVYELEQAEQDYPDIAKLHILGYSHQNRPIYALEINSAPGRKDGRPEAVQMGLHHAREWQTAEITMDLAQYFLQNYGKDNRITEIVNEQRVWFIPVMNPDGYVHSRTEYAMWRKNRRANDNGSYGVDPNRNYSYMWGGAGASSNPNSETYMGPDPFSEPENQAIRDFYLNRHVITSITHHSYGQLILYPWGYKPDLIGDTQPAEMGQAMAKHNGYADGPAMTLYPTNGDTVDWLYGVLRSIGFTFEHQTQFHDPYMGAQVAGLSTDIGDFQTGTFTYSVSPVGLKGEFVDVGLANETITADVYGKIALIERGGNTFAEKAKNAEVAGAIGAVIYNNTSGIASGTLGESGVVAIPVVGISRANGELIKDRLSVNEAVYMEYVENLFIRNDYETMWKTNLEPMLYSIEKAKDYASVIKGKVTDKATGELLEATLDMEITFDVPLEGERQGQILQETQKTSIETEGEYRWSVLPSKKPEIESPPYTITVTVPGYKPQTTTLVIEEFEKEHVLNFEMEADDSLGTNADLKDLTVSHGQLTPSFQPEVTKYTVHVGSNVASLDLTPFLADEKATLTIDGTTHKSGEAKSISLAPRESKEVNIVVTAEDEVTNNEYSITITRAASRNRGGGGGGAVPPATTPPTNTEENQEVTEEEQETPPSDEEQGTAPSPAESTAPFIDTENHWAADEINKAFRLGWLTGYPDLTFRPNQTITRLEFAALISRALGLEGDSSTLSFTDLNDIPEWGLAHVAALVREGLINGYEDGRFQPQRNITRTEIAAIIFRAAGLTQSPEATLDFVDAHEIPEWAKQMIATAAEEGLIQGLEGNRFAPHALATRAEAVVLIVRVLDFLDP